MTGGERRKKARPLYKFVTLSPADKVVLPANSRRTAVIFSNNDFVNNIFLAPNQSTLGTNGLLLNAGVATLAIWEEQYGQLAAAEWHASCTAGTSTLAIVELEG